MSNTNRPPGNKDEAANAPESVQPPTLQGDHDNQGCPPIETLRELDFASRPSASNSPSSGKANGKGGSKGIGKRFVISARISEGTSRKKRPLKNKNPKPMRKRIASK